MPKTRIESAIRNLRIELVVSDDDPTQIEVHVGADIVDEDGKVVDRYQEIHDVDTTGAAALAQVIHGEILEDRGITEQDLVTHKERQEQRRLEQEAEQGRRRQEREIEVAEAGEKLRQEHAGKYSEAEVEAARQRYIAEHPPFPFPGPSVVDEAMLAILEQRALEQAEALLAQNEAGEQYEQEQIEYAKNVAQTEADKRQRTHEAQGAPIADVPNRRPQ